MSAGNQNKVIPKDTEIMTFLYPDGRTNFITTRTTDGPTRDPRQQTDAACALAFKLVDVTGKTWGETIQASYKAADEMRGCTWEEWTGQPRPEPQQLNLF